MIGLRIARAQELVGRGLRVLRVFYSRDLIQMIYELYKTKIATATIWLRDFGVGSQTLYTGQNIGFSDAWAGCNVG